MPAMISFPRRRQHLLSPSPPLSALGVRRGQLLLVLAGGLGIPFYFLLPSTFIVRPGLGFSDCGEMGQQSLTYSFVARGTAFLAEHTEVAGNFNSITASRGSSPATKSFPHRGRIRDTVSSLVALVKFSNYTLLHGGDSQQQQKQKQKSTMQVRPCTGVLLLDMVSKHREKM
ncbi:hypothetical protein ZIOFF_029168 [Zingiber officinale]|uniref:Transmembrane protein n=1 Tax=Zingiber officinale TaxID=94328 RepID=A0A8J5H0Z2_ZINOF|nr:hypothetical protein ZIOFF_029168 [Zingiber officinale]